MAPHPGSDVWLASKRRGPIIGRVLSRRDAMTDAQPLRTLQPVAAPDAFAASASVRRQRLALAAYLAVIALHCAWVLSMPVFPSQDGPLHLYYVNIFRDLLWHAHGTYSNTYYIGRYLPAYSLYYYGLIALGSTCSLQAADKIMVCIFFIVFGLGVRRVMQVVSPSAIWAPLLALPMLLNWPLMMGFVNYALATGLACFALAIWCNHAEKPTLLPRVRFLLLLVAVILTHPVPWILAVAFVFFDLAIRATCLRRGSGSGLLATAFRLDLLTAVMAALGYFFLRSFRNIEGYAIHAVPSEGPFLHALLARAADYRHLFGIVLFVDGSTSSHLHRLLFLPAVLTLVVLAVGGLMRAWPARDSSPRLTWALFALGFLLVFPLIPANLNGSYFFAMRLMFLVYTCLAIAASAVLTSRRFALPVAAAFAALSLFTLVLAHRHITPIAHEIVALQTAAAVATDRPGLIVWPEDSTTGPLSFGPLLWAGAGYMRQHNAVLYNTTWLELAIIPIKVRPTALTRLDGQFSILPPRVAPNRRSLFETPRSQAETLSRVGYVVGMHEPGVSGTDLLTGGPTPTPGWTCHQTGDWQVCTPFLSFRKGKDSTVP